MDICAKVMRDIEDNKVIMVFESGKTELPLIVLDKKGLAAIIDELHKRSILDSTPILHEIMQHSPGIFERLKQGIINYELGTDKKKLTLDNDFRDAQRD